MRRHWTVRMRDRLRFPIKFGGFGFDSKTEAMLEEAAKILRARKVKEK